MTEQSHSPNGVSHDVSRAEPRPEDLLLRSEVVALCERKAADLAGLVLEAAEAGFPKSAREREAMEATATKLRYAIAQMPAAPLGNGVSQSAVERHTKDAAKDLSARIDIAMDEGARVVAIDLYEARRILAALAMHSARTPVREEGKGE